MAKCIEYNFGDILCDKTGVRYIRDIAPRIKEYRGYIYKYRKVQALCSCGKIFEKELSDIKKGSRCQECGKEKHRNCVTQYKEGFVFDNYNTILLKRLEKNGTSVNCEFRCGICGETFKMCLNDFMKSKYKVCHECVLSLTEKERRKYNVGDIIAYTNSLRFFFEQELTVDKNKQRRGIFYEVDVNNKKISSSFSALLFNVVSGHAVGTKSIANKLFLDALQKLPYLYQVEKTFTDLLSDKGFPLRYDFSIYYNKKWVLFELDGEQHYKNVPYFGGEKGFQSRRRNDELKNEYAQKNGYVLIRIPYTSFSLISPDFIEKLLQGGE